MTPNENSHFFIHSRRHTPARADGSWWLGLSRDAHQHEAERRKVRMSNSPEARHTSSIIVGHTGRTR